jgi:hypothetical protein
MVRLHIQRASMSNWKYDSGGHKKDYKKYAENWKKIFGDKSKDSKKDEKPKEK